HLVTVGIQQREVGGRVAGCEPLVGHEPSLGSGPAWLAGGLEASPRGQHSWRDLTLPPATAGAEPARSDAGRGVDLFQVADAGGGVRAVALPFLADPDAAAAAPDRRAVAAAGDHLAVVRHQAVSEID